jgi:hypothetical protein
MATLKEILGDAYKADMTLADIESALNGKNLADLSGGQYVSISKHNSIVNGLTAERDDYKTKYTDTLNEAQKAELANAEREQKYKAIERENSINRYEKKLSSSVKDETIRNEIAILMADGKYDEAIDKQNAYLATETAEIEKRIKDELMKQNPQAQAGNDGAGAITKEQFDQMTVAERTKLYKEQPEKYNEFVNQN